jgi:hypothetical protein
MSSKKEFLENRPVQPAVVSVVKYVLKISVNLEACCCKSGSISMFDQGSTGLGKCMKMVCLEKCLNRVCP